MTNLAYEQFKQAAAVLKKEDNICYSSKDPKVIDLMADRYCLACDTGDEHNKNKYIAGLMLRFWGEIGKSMAKSPNIGLEFEDFMMWNYEAIEYACKYRAWQNPEKNVNAQQAIRQCISTIRLQHYYDYNLDKHKANYSAQSLDEPMSADSSEKDMLGSISNTLLDEGEEDRLKQFEATLTARALVQGYINRKKLIEAIILDTIAFNDTQKITREAVKTKDVYGKTHRYSKTYSEFWPFKCVQILSKLPQDYPTYFKKNYNINPKEFEVALETIKAATNQKLYRYLRNTLSAARTAITY